MVHLYFYIPSEMGIRCSRIGDNAIQEIVGYIGVRIFFLILIFSFIDKKKIIFGLGSQTLNFPSYCLFVLMAADALLL